METKLNGVLDDFLATEKNKVNTGNAQPKVMLEKKEGLIERVDKIYLVNDGRQLLREQY